MENEKKAYVIHPDDNVAIVLEDVPEGGKIKYFLKDKSCVMVACDPIDKGHKVAIRSIVPRATVVKYGIPIGVASKRIKKGQLVHTHNLVSFVR
jgi:hypothetical protein